MKNLIWIVVCLLCSCKKPFSQEKVRAIKSVDLVDDQTTPNKVQKIHGLIKNLKPNTTIHEFYDQLESVGVILDEEAMLYGGAESGERSEAWDLRIQGEYLLTIESKSMPPEHIWEIKVMKHSIDHFKNASIGNYWKGAKTVFPYYLKGHIMWKDVKAWEVEKKQ